jgi:hypothetical protein
MILITMILMIILFYHQEDSKMLEVYIMSQKNRQLIPYTLTDTDNSALVRVHNGCSSGRNIWETMSFVFEAMLLITASILTFESNDVIEELDESHFLVFLSLWYVHILYN